MLTCVWICCNLLRSRKNETDNDIVDNYTDKKGKSAYGIDIYKQVQSYPNQPWYEIEYSQNACGYEY